MKVIDVAEKFPVFDVPTGLAVSLIAAGTHKQFIPTPKPAPAAKTTWWIVRGQQIEDYEFPPEIRYRCDTCGGHIGVMQGPTVERTQKFLHCKTQESVPDDIQRQYREMRQSWEKRFGGK